MKAIIYCRVSTKEQAETGYSLEAQEKACRKLALDNEYETVKVFIERGESAKTQDRTQLKKLIEYSVRNKKDLSALIVWKFDRFARNLSDQTELLKSFGELGIRVLSCTENNEDSSIGKLMRNIVGSFAQFENDVKSERTISGMKQAIQEGRWCWRTPFGYKRVVEQGERSKIIPSKDSKFVLEAFEMLGSALYKQTDIAQHLKKQGCPKITKSLLNKILRNPLYAGLIKTDFFDDFIEGTHAPLLSKELFFKVQAILDGKRVAIVPQNRNHPDFPLRNFLRCPHCNTKLTGGWSKGRLGKKYAYYHCRTKGCSLSLRKHDLEASFYAYLKTFQPKPEILDLFEEIVIDTWKTKQSEQIKYHYQIEKGLIALSKKRDKIEELIIEGKIDEETYSRKFGEVKQAILAKQIELNETTIELNDVGACIEYCKYFLANIADLWLNSGHNLKQQFQTLLFPDKITYKENGSFEPTVTALIFSHLGNKTPDEYKMATPTGFEPVLRA